MPMDGSLDGTPPGGRSRDDCDRPVHTVSRRGGRVEQNNDRVVGIEAPDRGTSGFAMRALNGSITSSRKFLPTCSEGATSKALKRGCSRAGGSRKKTR